jgi:DNA topoisomerase-1
VKLIYTREDMPGIHRRRAGKGFAYFFPDGTPLRDAEEIARIKSLAIPPAYEDVWICPIPNGHLQATGIDARGRKQYRYHPEWHERVSHRKFALLPDFVLALPRIRNRVRLGLREETVSRERVICGVVALLDRTGYRIGNKEYMRFNRSFGLASLLMRHLKKEEGGWVMRFRGKSGQPHTAAIKGSGLSSLFVDLQELPGQHLFCYEDDNGEVHDIGTSDINEWLKEAGEGDFTAKQFRTWKATLFCARELAKEPPAESEREMKRVIQESIKRTAEILHHTPATCRKYYVPPLLFAAYRSGELFKRLNAKSGSVRRSSPMHGLHVLERKVLKLMQSTPARRRPKSG